MAPRAPIALMALAGVVAIDGRPAHADVPGVIAQSARTAVHSVRDGVLTFGRTTRAFFRGGMPAAEEAWYENAETTRENARRNASRVREEAGVASAPAYRSYDDEPDHYRYDDAPDHYREDGSDRLDEPLPPADADH